VAASDSNRPLCQIVAAATSVGAEIDQDDDEQAKQDSAQRVPARERTDHDNLPMQVGHHVI
jgi:hypothetical protein